ncbi:MAG: response regulator transcription factor [Firmicutes bacterium]|nr:response regulator transcription factor [Bacillota bacterium]
MLRRALALEGFEVGTALSGQEALEQALLRWPDVVVLDWMLPGMDGLEVCRRLRRSGDVPILMLTARDAVEDRVLGLESGADDYLVKPFALEELVARVRALLRRRARARMTQGGEAPAEETLRFADLSLDTASREARRGNRRIPLSTTEFDLLELFMRNPRRVLPRDLIMERVWGYDFQGESNVLEMYVGYLRRKLEAAGEPRLLHTVRGVGYGLKEAEE